jgi:hypothetical protein
MAQKPVEPVDPDPVDPDLRIRNTDCKYWVLQVRLYSAAGAVNTVHVKKEAFGQLQPMSR